VFCNQAITQTCHNAEVNDSPNEYSIRSEKSLGLSYFLRPDDLVILPGDFFMILLFSC
jgi:hypothetical protein